MWQVHYWEQLHFDIPYSAMDITHTNGEHYRTVREQVSNERDPIGSRVSCTCVQVMTVVRDYNGIISALLPEERSLFAERIGYLDKKIHPGVTKLSWSSKGISEFFVKDCSKHCSDVMRLVSSFKAAKHKVAKNCRLMGSCSLVAIKKKVRWPLLLTPCYAIKVEAYSG